MTTEAKRRPNRSKNQRVPLSKRNRISYDNLEKGYVYRVVNDVDARLQNALEGGYEFVESNSKIGDERVAEAASVDSRVSKPVGGGVTGFLMRIREDWYEEDQKAKAEKVAETEKAMSPEAQREQFEANVYGDGLKQDSTPK